MRQEHSITIQAAGGQMVLVVVLDDGWGEDKLAAKLGRVLDLNGRRNGMERQLVGNLAEVIQTANEKQGRWVVQRYPPLSTGVVVPGEVL